MNKYTLRVLLIDDDEDDYIVTRDLLNDIENTTIHLDWLTTYEAALPAIQRAEHDAYLLDYHLGPHTGLDLLRAARAAGCAAPLILLTGLGDHAVDVQAMQAGASDYLVKGHITPTVLERALRYAVERANIMATLRSERQTLADARARLTAVVNGLTDALLVLDTQTCVVMLNPAGAQLYAQDDVRPGHCLPAHAGSEAITALATEARAQGQAITREITWPDDRYFTATATPVNTGDVVVSLHDVTNFRLLEQVKNDFIATASHDLKNPLTGIMGYATLISKVGPLTLEQLDFSRRIQKLSGEMRDLIFNLLELARSDRGVLLNLEIHDLTVLMQSAAEEFTMQAVNKQQTVTLNIPAQPVFIEMDMIRMRQVIHNLVGNALKYTPSGGLITLSLVVTDNEAQVEVCDTGLGIPLADQPRIFDRFYRVRAVATQDIEGNGLGLAIVKSIVDQHHGRVWVRSSGVPGEGTCFGFGLPYRASNA